MKLETRCVITGIGPVTPIGIGKGPFWRSLVSGASRYSHIDRFDLADWDRIRIAAQIRDFTPVDFVDPNVIESIANIGAKNGGLSIFYGLAGATLAVEDSGIVLAKIDPERVGVIVGSGSGDLSIIRHGNINFVRAAYALANALPGLISKKFGFHGVSKSVSAACATGSVALDEGYQRILNGDCDLVIVSSAEAPIDTPIFLGTEEDRRNGSKALSMRNDIVNGMIPFDEKRDGPVLSEGAGILILENEDHARDRGAHVHAEVVGCGTYTCFDQNLVRITKRGYEKAMIKALRSSGISDFSRTYVNAHGTATRLNDRVESTSIVNIFGDDVPVSSFKGTIGHAQAAAPAIELIGCILALNKRTIPRSNLMNAAIDCAKLDYVTEERVLELDYVVKNAAGFSGVYSSTVLRKYIW